MGFEDTFKKATEAAGISMDVDAALLEPIEGISLERYAQLAKTIAERELDEGAVPAMVQEAGHTLEAWKAAYDGWNDRLSNMALATQFGQIYQQAQAL